MAEKRMISQHEPCVICGKTDWCFRLIHDDGTTEHCCYRIGESQVQSQWGVFVLNRKNTLQTNIGDCWCYKSVEDRAKSNALWAKAHGKEPGNVPKIIASMPNSQPVAAKPTVEEAQVADDKRIDSVYRAFMDLLVMENKHERSLRSDWDTDATKGLYDKIMKSYPIKSLPPADWIRKGKKFIHETASKRRSEIMIRLTSRVGNPEGVPGFYINKYGKWDMAGSEGILFPTFNEIGQITSLRLREDYPLIKGNVGTYKHSYEEGADVWIYRPDDGGTESRVYEKPAGKPAGKYKAFSSTGYLKGCGNGSHYSLYAPAKCDYTKVYVTEGEKKALVASELLGCPCVSLPGVGTFRLMFESPLVDYLKSKGMKQAIIAYDADKNENIRVLRAEQAAVQEFIKNGIQIAIGEWNANWGKGLDDTLVQGLRPNIYLVQ